MKSRLQEKYRSETVPALMKRFGWKNMMAVPKLKKITVNIGLGEASQNAKLLDTAAVELGQITGQKAIITRAKKSIANFKIRKGMPIGCAVTLRGDHMYEFLDRLCNVVLPRVRDFRGLPQNSFDGRGNYTLGLKDQLVFPEIDYTRVDKINGTHSKDRQVAQETEIQGAHTQPLPLLRTRAGIYTQVSDVQNLFSRYGAQGRNSRRRESQLVGELCRRIPLPIF